MYFFWRKVDFRKLLKDIKQLNPSLRNVCSKGKKDNLENVKLPPEPTTCCMSGCANCVWLKYAQELSEIMHFSGDKANEIILSKITDPNMKAFLSMELRNMQAHKESSKNNNSNESDDDTHTTDNKK